MSNPVFGNLWNPSAFQGFGRKRSYFEGWYHKHVNAQKNAVYSLIPGISYNEKGQGQAFLQMIRGSDGSTVYLPFSTDEFQPDTQRYELILGKSRFSATGIDLNVDTPQLKLKGSVEYLNPVSYPVSLFRPGIMGWYRYVPQMECLHGLVSLDHGLEGALEINGEIIDFSGGRGYLEKDWGRSMPQSWIWFQTNAFEEQGVSCMVSVARIPWMGSSFPGFLAVLHRPGQGTTTWATYTGAKLVKGALGEKSVELEIRGSKTTLCLEASRSVMGFLQAPLQGAMDRRIAESVDAKARVTLKDKRGQILWTGNADPCGLELVGEAQGLFP